MYSYDIIYAYKKLLLILQFTYITRYYILKQKKNKETKDFKEMR